MARPLELKPRLLREAKASCGCSFAVARETALDDRNAKWVEGDTLVAVPHDDEHRDLVREVAAGPMGEVEWPPSQEVLEMLAAEMTKRVEEGT